MIFSKHVKRKPSNKFDSKSTPFEAEDILTPLSVKKSSDDIPPHYNISIIKSRPPFEAVDILVPPNIKWNS